METTTFTAPDITCQGCANSIKRALGTVEGVAEVKVDIGTKAVEVTHEAAVTREALAQKLDRAGFPAA